MRSVTSFYADDVSRPPVISPAEEPQRSAHQQSRQAVPQELVAAISIEEESKFDFYAENNDEEDTSMQSRPAS